MFSTSTADTSTSISPVARFGFSLPSGRLETLAGHAQNVPITQVLKVSLIVENALGDALAVTQVNEGDTTVVAAASHPTGQGNSLSNICGGSAPPLV